MFRRLIFLPACVVLISFFSCKKDDPVIDEPPAPAPQPVGKVAFEFRAVAGTKPLAFDGTWYMNSSKETFSVSKFNYYFTNIRFKKTDGSYFSESESYHLIQHAEKIETFTVTNMPVGTYTGIEFLIGVDSLRNVSGSQTGALDVAHNMFWEWNTGYIFYKLEGTYFDGNTPEPGYSIHIGGFSGPDNCLQKVTLNFPEPLVITENKTSQIKMKTAVEEIFDSPEKITIAKYYEELANGNGPKTFQRLSVNYRDMFTAEQVIN